MKKYSFNQICKRYVNIIIIVLFELTKFHLSTLYFFLKYFRLFNINKLVTLIAFIIPTKMQHVIREYTVNSKAEYKLNFCCTYLPPCDDSWRSGSATTASDIVSFFATKFRIISYKSDFERSQVHVNGSAHYQRWLKTAIARFATEKKNLTILKI